MGDDAVTIKKRYFYLAGILILLFIGVALASPFAQNLAASAGTDIAPAQSLSKEPPVGDAIFKGPENAQVTIIEYSSFSCPYCNKVRPTLDQILQAYPTQVKYVYKHFDRGGPDSKAAQAAECARDQDKFWEMHDMLFDRGPSGDHRQYATLLGLNEELFDECIGSRKYVKRVRADTYEGQSFGARGTPTFFINGKMVVGSQQFSVFKEVIDAELGNL